MGCFRKKRESTSVFLALLVGAGTKTFRVTEALARTMCGIKELLVAAENDESVNDSAIDEIDEVCMPSYRNAVCCFCRVCLRKSLLVHVIVSNNKLS